MAYHWGGFILVYTVNAHMYMRIFCTVHSFGIHFYMHICGYVRQEFKPAALSKPALISYPIKCVCEHHAQPTDIDVMVIYLCICMYVNTYNSQHICIVQHWFLASPSLVNTHTDGVKKYESSFRVRMSQAPDYFFSLANIVPYAISNHSQPHISAVDCNMYQLAYPARIPHWNKNGGEIFITSYTRSCHFYKFQCS